MLATDHTIELGRLCCQDVATTGPRHQLFRLRDQPTIVMPYARCQGGWECIVVASRTPRNVHHLSLTDAQIADAATTIPARPDRDPDGYARLVWLSQVFRRWPGGAMFALAEHIVNELRVHASLHIHALTLANHNRIAERLPTTRPVAVGPLLDRLVSGGFLTRASNSVWRLTLPTSTSERG